MNLTVGSSDAVAWAAGFFDGEGTFSSNVTACRRKDGTELRRRYFRLFVSQKEPELLERFRDTFGAGNVQSDGRDGHKLAACGKTAFNIACHLWPYLGERKRADFKRHLKLMLESRIEGVV